MSTPLISEVNAPQGRLRVSPQAGGDATPVLFLHADGGTLHQWDALSSKTGTTHVSVAFDRRGHGESAMPRSGSFRHEDAALDALAVADAAGFQDFVLVGHSGGALTSVACAARAPQRVAALVLIDPPPDPAVLPPGSLAQMIEGLRSERYKELVEQHYRSIAGPDPVIVERVLADLRATQRATVIGSLVAMSEFDPKPLLSRYNGPRLSIVQPGNAQAPGALHRLGGFDSLSIPGTGHWLQLNAPDRVAEVISAFMSDHGLGPREIIDRPVPLTGS